MSTMNRFDLDIYIYYTYNFCVFQVRIKMTKYKSSFQDEWLVNENYSCWVEKTIDKHKAYCTIYLKEFSVSGEGIKTLDVHTEGKGHKEKRKKTDN